ncbi:hypothetical protein HTS88_20985 [Pseudarthrobacter oxydans]|uniref:hypothetical protein n=1 Tax=Pseudarthrobacter oxydans TaxID=1671 RepID=UPI001572E5F0|nr:hypothetical protein [Pseudarthrobacter oxydans]NSX38857.1 hypothetical protein [Pseudarthrobacter oxydans]
MDITGPTPPAAKTFADFLNAESSAPRGPQRHRITWFIDGFVSFEMECLHEEMAPRFVCDKESAEEDRSWFIECFEGDKTPLRDGVIESWWDGTGEDSVLSWRYAAEPAALDTVPGPDEKLLIELRALEESLATALADERQRETAFMPSTAFVLALTEVRDMLRRHSEPEDTMEADAKSLAQLADEIGYCLYFRPLTSMRPDTPAAQKVSRLADWLQTAGWRRTGPVRPLDKFAS